MGRPEIEFDDVGVGFEMSLAQLIHKGAGRCPQLQMVFANEGSDASPTGDVALIGKIRQRTPHSDAGDTELSARATRPFAGRAAHRVSPVSERPLAIGCPSRCRFAPRSPSARPRPRARRHCRSACSPVRIAHPPNPTHPGRGSGHASAAPSGNWSWCPRRLTRRPWRDSAQSRCGCPGRIPGAAERPVHPAPPRDVRHLRYSVDRFAETRSVDTPMAQREVLRKGMWTLRDMTRAGERHRNFAGDQSD